MEKIPFATRDFGLVSKYLFIGDNCFQVANTHFTNFLEGLLNQSNDRKYKTSNKIKVSCTTLAVPLCNSKVAIYALGTVWDISLPFCKGKET